MNDDEILAELHRGHSQSIRLLRRMLEIRFFEDQVERLFFRGLVRGSTHLCQGQEAVSVGACSVLEPGDAMTCTYRGHGAVLAMGAPLDRSMAEILGKAQGLCGGKGGSMHLTDVAVGALGSFAIVGANTLFALGTALAAQFKRNNRVALTFFGDGATNIGGFHEALNLAAIWRLPLVFICENNLYGEYSPIASTTSTPDLASRGRAYGIPAAAVDGNDLMAVASATRLALARARNGEGPSFIEALTYRQKGHSRTDSGTYRPAGELEAWLDKDPINRFERVLLDASLVTENDLQALRDEVKGIVEAATDRALSWPEPDDSELVRDVFA